MLHQLNDAAGILEQKSDVEVDDDVIDIERIFRAVRRQVGVVAVCAALGLGLGFVYVMTAVPRYTASLDLLIDSNNNRLTEQLTPAGGLAGDEASILSQVQLLKSERIANAVARRLDLGHNISFVAPKPSLIDRIKGTARNLLDFRSWFAEEVETKPQDNTGLATALVQQSLGVDRVGRTYVLNLSFTSHDPQLAATIVRTVAEAYLTDQLDSRYEATRRASVWLQERIDELRQKSLETDLAVQRFRKNNDLLETNGQLVSDQQLSEMSSQLISAKADASRIEAKSNNIKAIIETKDTRAVISGALDSSIINDLRTKYLEASKREADLSARLGSNHLGAVRLRSDMDEYNRLIFEELGRIADSLRGEFEVAQKRVASVEAALKTASERSSRLNETMVQLRELERASESYRNLYQIFLQRYQEAAQQQSFPIVSTRVISEASVPTGPSSPRRTLSMALFMTLGIMFGVAIGAVREIRERFYRTGDQVRSDLKLEFLGYVPIVAQPSAAKRAKWVPDENANKRVIHKVDVTANYVVDHPMSSFAERLRSAKIAADLAIGEKTPKIIGVVSVLPSEGKSTISINFAELLSLQGARTLLVDADLRNPGLSRAVAPHAKTSVVDTILEPKDLKAISMTNPDTGLTVVPTTVRRRIPHTSEIIASPGMRRFLRDVSPSFDYIVLDLPPLGPVVDARAIAPQVDAFIFVVEWGRTARNAVRSVLRAEPAIRDKCLGVVLNKVDQDRMKHYIDFGSIDYYAPETSKYYTTGNA